MCPISVLDEWAKTPPEEQKKEEAEMTALWNAWTAKAGKSLLETVGAGKTKRVTKSGVTDVRNEVMMYSIVEAESLEKAVEMFKDHPHFTIPQAWIDVMPANKIPGM